MLCVFHVICYILVWFCPGHMCDYFLTWHFHNVMCLQCYLLYSCLILSRRLFLHLFSMFNVFYLIWLLICFKLFIRYSRCSHHILHKRYQLWIISFFLQLIECYNAFILSYYNNIGHNAFAFIYLNYHMPCTKLSAHEFCLLVVLMWEYTASTMFMRLCLSDS